MMLSPRDYSNAATLLLVAYVVFQLPGTLLIKQIGPARQFAGAMIFVKTDSSLAPLLPCLTIHKI